MIGRASPVILLTAGAAIVAALYVRKTGGIGGAAQNAGAAVIDAADGVLSGGVFAIGERIGLADTRQDAVIDQGRAELEAGDYWSASFHLPAGEFIRGSWNRLFN